MFTFLRYIVVICIVSSAALVTANNDVKEHSSLSDKVTTFVIPMHPREGVNPEEFYFSRLLALALDKTVAIDGPYRLQDAKVLLTDNRVKAALRSGHIDIIWSPTSPEFEKMLLPVRVPALKEFSDYRILVIRRDDQEKFTNIKTLEDLRKLSGGMSSHWTDMGVMKANRLPVVSAVGYDRLFRMLAAGRFDYFSRGLYQVKLEIDMYPDLDLVMEERLMLHYPSPHYFFVNRDNSALAERIERGLKLALADGSFDDLFFSIPRHQWAKDELKRNQRHVINLEVP
jgi:ABC-type amino acid transport substrate-binding protein